MMQLPGKKHKTHENHERWLVSYADFITLLFAFFVVLYATSTNNPSKQKALEESIRSEMNLDGTGGQPVFSPQNSLSKSLVKNPVKPNQKNPVDDEAGTIGDPTLEAIKSEMIKNKQAEEVAAQKTLSKNIDIISEGLKEELDNRKIILVTKEKDIVLYIDTKLAFEAGSARLNKDFNGIFEKIATTMDKVRGQVRISGHSDLDRVPAGFNSYFELSSARAAQFGSALIKKSHSLEDRIAMESFGALRPINKSGSLYQNISNSRIEITVHQK